MPLLASSVVWSHGYIRFEWSRVRVLQLHTHFSRSLLRSLVAWSWGHLIFSLHYNGVRWLGFSSHFNGMIMRSLNFPSNLHTLFLKVISVMIIIMRSVLTTVQSNCSHLIHQSLNACKLVTVWFFNHDWHLILIMSSKIVVNDVSVS